MCTCKKDCVPIKPVKRLCFSKSRWGNILTWLMKPLMYLAAGTHKEAVQETHFWNREDLSEAGWLPDRSKVVKIPGNKKAFRKRWVGILPISHIPILGGWRDYVVLAPPDSSRKWYVGWQCRGVFGISTIPIRGPVRVLCGPEPCRFFAVTHNGLQISLEKIGEGVIGQGGPFCHLPLR